MERSWYWRLTLVLGLVALAAYYVAPSALYFFSPPEVRRSKTAIKELIPGWLPDKRVNMGIDLQGGLHLVMGVDTEKAVQDRADRAGDELVDSMKEKSKPLKRVRRESEAPELSIEMESSEDWAQLKPLLEDRVDSWEIKSRAGASVIWAMKDTYQSLLREDAVAQALKTLRNRIDTYGVTEPEVRKRGQNSILIQIAGLTADEEQSVKQGIIGKTAQLEFKMVDDESHFFAEVAAKPDKPEDITLDYDGYRGAGDALISSPFLTSKSRSALQNFMRQNPPPTDRAVRYQEIKNKDATSSWRTWLLDRKTPLTGDALVNAFVAFDRDKNNYYVAMKFDRRGAVIFEQLTGANVKKRMAIVLDDIVDSAPVIEGRIPNGNASITLGGFKNQKEILDDANSLSIVLKAGALPAPVYPQEERTVGASLGDDAVQKGKVCIAGAFLCVILVMVGLYRLSGVIGVLAVVVNMLLLIAILAAFGATITLPGLAGLALTVGMAVDANIIQFERIREELRIGKTARAAVDAGFDKAFSAIFDSNVTTLLAAIVLYQFGSGPIRGFATTLGIGVFVNTFTAVVVPRLCLDYLTRSRRVQELSI